MSISGHRQQVADMERHAPEIMNNRDATLKRIEDLQAQQQGLVGDFGILQAIAPTRDEDRAKRASEIQDQIQQLQKMLGMPRQPPGGRTCVPARKRRIGFARGSSARTTAWRRPTPTPRRMSGGSRNNCSNRTSR
jgi:hypothetical protein